MARKRKKVDRYQPNTVLINGKTIKIPSIARPKEIKEVVKNGQKTIHVTFSNHKDMLLDFIQSFDIALTAASTKDQKEAICYEFSRKADLHHDEACWINRDSGKAKAPLERGYKDAMIAKGYYREK